MLKRLLFLALVTAVFIFCFRGNIENYSQNNQVKISFNDLSSDFSWAQEAVDTLVSKGAINGIEDNVFSPKGTVTKEQFAKMLVIALEKNHETSQTQTYIDVPSARWSFEYIEAAKDFFPKSASLAINEFAPESWVTREEAAAALINALDADPSSVDTSATLADFSDHYEVSDELSAHVALAVQNGILKGDSGRLRPKAVLSRAESAVFLYRVLKVQNGGEILSSATPISGKSTVTLEQAKAWAKAKGAHERFINISELYWKYGEKTGIRPEVLYAQAAKETNYGKYTGNVVPEQNNWAGIKTKDASGDKTEDHESFDTPEDGVRAHFNHMAAYLGSTPSGKTHDRYSVVMTAAWAGTIEYVEELGGHWAPAADYGYDIVEKYLVPMENTKNGM